MMRYSVIKNKFPREILLLKATPCKWGKCTFCDYIHDNSMDIEHINEVNLKVIEQVTGEYGVLEIINSGNVFELPKETLEGIKKKVKELNIKRLFLEAHWIYRSRLQEMRDFFGVDIIFKTGLESFDEEFREDVLKKGFNYKNLEELKGYFNSVCLMVGIKGQTKEMIKNDIKVALENFEHFTVNVYTENTTQIKPDKELIDWFQDEYRWLEDEKKCEVLWVNTDFGVG
ncbi:radical SAM protein [Oceanirhabdus sp. W0125-5]|uniref:radical SAM protein n=1 Tax=Oceanirhabdus sp. W0125-5 TaxID=2999116 RepID=UPI0022F33520|nr:radical SAM protein [Oceanirhabdus sp. W0125-5]WBW99580.1 radical SAM protein [Oceanirhabdus sp. W0125-5]